LIKLKKVFYIRAKGRHQRGRASYSSRRHTDRLRGLGGLLTALGVERAEFLSEHFFLLVTGQDPTKKRSPVL
jgi:hypothetical protein